MQSLGERLKITREKKGLSQVEVYRRTNINNKTLSKYEKGDTKPDIETIELLSNFYEVDLEWLMTGSIDSFKDTSDKIDDSPIVRSVQKFLRTETSGLTKEQQEILADDITDYLEYRKNKLLKNKDN
jgi:transcriptional regulator with XRE-family HTH domain